MQMHGIDEEATSVRGAASENPFNHDRHLPFLLNRVGFIVRDRMSAKLAAEGVTLPMWRVLAALYCEGELSISSLGPHTALEQSTLSRTVSSLHGRKFVSRKTGKADARNVLVQLTARGRTLTEKLIPHARHADAILTRGLSADDIERLRILFDQLYDNMRNSR